MAYHLFFLLPSHIATNAEIVKMIKITKALSILESFCFISVSFTPTRIRAKLTLFAPREAFATDNALFGLFILCFKQ